MIHVEDVLVKAEQLMCERYGEGIRSRQIKILAEAIVLVINEHFVTEVKPPTEGVQNGNTRDDKHCR
jgi:hypothetical protein